MNYWTLHKEKHNKRMRKYMKHLKLGTLYDLARNTEYRNEAILEIDKRVNPYRRG